MTLVYTAVALLVALVAALIVWSVSTGYLIEQREQALGGQGEAGAAVAGGQPPGPTDVQQLITARAGFYGSDLLVTQGGRTVASAGLTASEVPTALQEMVEGGAPARQRLLIDGRPSLLVGIPLPGGGSYYEASPLTELDSALRHLSVTLAVTSLFAVLLTLLFGWSAGRRALRPVEQLTATAQAVAEGDLTARMSTEDPDLAPIASGFNATVATLERRVHAAARFAGNFSHEVRTPLTTMANAIGVLDNRRGELSPVAREALSLLSGQISRFQRLALDLLEISRITEGPPPDRPQVRLSDVVAEIAAGAGWPQTDLSSDPLLVEADPRHLEHVLLNLVRNADEHGGGLVRIATCGDHRRARIEVDDAGPGVPEEERTHIFERFHRAPGPRAPHAAGFGVGLALVAEIAALYNGRVWVEDRPGGGARFVVELPMATS